LGTTEDNSAPGGSLRSANPNFGVKPSLTLVNALRNINDPRLDRWVMPVQKKWDRSVQSETDITVVNSFGEEYEVTLMPTSLDNLDTSLYVGLPVGLPSIQAINFNIGSDQDAFDPEKNPHVSFLHPRYRVNREEFLNVKLMTFSEVNFLMAEAVLRGDMGVSGDIEQFYKEGILASMQEWGVVSDAVGFNFDTYYSNSGVDLSVSMEPLEYILNQKWISSWLRPEAWFDWRRTGY